jgi:Ni/Fe-hydrogenase subunit HybB-like protein
MLLLLIVIAKSLAGWLGKQPFAKIDNTLSLVLFIATHVQLLLGLILYTQSPQVQFAAGFMKDKNLRYWTVEHSVMMLVAVILITIARTSMKKMPVDWDRHRRLFVFNASALAIIIAAILHSGRGLV